MNNTPLQNRRELLFLYDASYCNPNGDPADENKPRTDPETMHNLVSDVRLKRTIRDFLREVKGQEIFVHALADEDGNVPDAKERANSFLPDQNYSSEYEAKNILDKTIISKCVDVRLFGGTIPLEIKYKDEKGKSKTAKGSSITHTGPVQFKMGKSLHKVSVERIKGTGAFASKSGSQQQTFRTEFMVPYSLIGFYGVVNEHRAKEVDLTEGDLQNLHEAMWDGIKHLITRSKIGQNPRLLFQITYNPGNFQISELDKKVELVSDQDDLAIRSCDDYVLKIDKLVDKLEKYKSKIESVEFYTDDEIRFSLHGETYSGTDLGKALGSSGVKVSELELS